MARRTVLTSRQRSALFALPQREADLLRHYTLSDEDLQNIGARRRPRNKLGFALQLCVLRHPGRLLAPGEFVPPAVVGFIGRQLDLDGDELADYAVRSETRHEHLAELRRLYGFRSFSGGAARELVERLREEAEQAQSNEDLARRFVEACRDTRTILPATTTIERLCADALVDAERRIEARITERIPPGLRRDLEHLLEETADAGVTRFVWLRQFEPGNNSADANRLLDRLEHVRRLDVPEGLFHEIPPHRITRLRRQGERYFADGLRELPDNRRLAILAVCAVEWEMFLADAVVETHDRVVGRTYREAARACEVQLGDETAAVREALRAFAELGRELIGARDAGEALDAVIADGPGWEGLGDLVSKAAALASTTVSDPLNHVLGGYSRFRRYTPRMLRTLDIEASPAAEPLLEAVGVLRSDGTARPTGFLRPNSKWSRLLRTQSDHRLWETAVLFHLRDAFRAGDVWLARSRRYGDIRKALLSAPAVADADRSLPAPASPHDWLAERRLALDEGLRRLAAAARAGAIAGGSIEDSVLRVERTEGAVPDGAAALVADLYRRMPEARITDILLEVDDATRFTEAFTHLRTGEPCRDRIGLLNVLLAEGVNLGLRKMAEATTTHGFWELMRIARWHVEGDAFDRALAVVVEAQAALPMAAFWGTGRTASSDGQFFPAGGRGEALNLVNARYGAEPGVKAYSHVSDRFSPFATQTIPATVHEAPYILDGLLMNETGRRVREQYADTGGFTDHVFAACSILGYAFVPRIRDLPSKRLYVFERSGVPKPLRPLVGGKVNVDLIDRNWADILRVAATMAAGTMRPSQLLRKLAAYPRQNELAAALREVGRIERSLFMIEWTTDPDVRRRALVGLNKGEAHHALKRAINFHQRGELRDRTGEGQHYRVAGLNLLAAIIIYWNTLKLGDAVFARGQAGLEVSDELLAHVSPLGWEHINLTGEYRWPGADRRAPRNA